MEEDKMPLTEHLTELRKRIFISLGSVLLIFLVSFNFSGEIFGALTLPLKAEMKLSMTSPYVQLTEKPPTPLVFLAPAEAFWMHFKVAFMAAVVASLPVIFLQFWQFISPGLLPKEKKYFLPFLFFAVLLFTVGAVFCFVIILPFAMTFLLGYKTAQMTPMLSVGSYIDFCLKFILAFGAIFELPLVIIFLTRFGIVTPSALARNRKYAVLAAFILAAALTPTPDAFNQTLMAVPIILLYEIGILLSRIMFRKASHG
ncbi:MAG: twin-arginine translocase subunit TatC [Nitrospirae bacterium]|nr:twin-arginine translocase subunit TatC [Nitrospirota bacterium]